MNQQPNDGAEIILLDDISTDESWQICLELAAQFPDHIRLLQHDQNRGLSAARNTMLDAARGDYIWFLDSDDYLLGNCIAQAKQIIDHGRADILLFDYKKRRSLFKKSFPGFGPQAGTDWQKLIAGVFEYRKMYAWLKISKRSLWADDLRFPEGKTFEDIATIPRLLLRCKSYHYTPRAWVYYRIRANSILSSATRTPNYFDVHKNEHLAAAMMCFPASLAAKSDPPDRDVLFYAGHFVAKEYIKLVKRFKCAQNIQATQAPDNPAHSLITYLQKMEAGSPIDFHDLRRAYLKRLRMWDYVVLGRAVAAVKETAVNA